MTSIAPKIWPPDYLSIFKERADRLSVLLNNPDLIIGAKSYYSRPENWLEFIEHWMITYDPRNSKNKNLPRYMPFILFPRQKDMFQFLLECYFDGESGLIEKCRDMGATWLCCAFSICLWLFVSGSSIGWGSRKEQLVDKIGDPDSIFEKLRMLLNNLPVIFLPDGYNDKQHCSYMKLINPENGSTITGESGDNIGRGGRKSIYFKDESAHYDRPEKIEAALGDNTDVQIDISSVNGTANVFARRRKGGKVWEPGCKIESGETRVLILDWREHPNKTQEWYDKRRKKAEQEGLLHIFAQEVDRDYAAAVEGVLIPAQWVQAAVDLHIKFAAQAMEMEEGLTYIGLDVADEGGDLNALCTRKGIILKDLDKWAQGDTGQTANKALQQCRIVSADELNYDCIGVGAGVKAETNRLKRKLAIPKKLKIIPWNANGKLVDPDKRSIPDDEESPLNKDLYSNLKAQGWWNLRMRFERTWMFVNQGVQYDIDKLICIPSTTPHFHELIAELSQPTYTHNSSGKILVNKKPDGTRSPNLADAVNIAYWPYKPKIKKVGTW